MTLDASHCSWHFAEMSDFESQIEQVAGPANTTPPKHPGWWAQVQDVTGKFEDGMLRFQGISVDPLGTRTVSLQSHGTIITMPARRCRFYLPSSLVEYQFQSITGEAMTTEHWDEFKKMLPETLREK